MSFVVNLDIEGRKLRIRQRAQEGTGFWVCELEEKYGNDQLDPLLVGSMRITGDVEGLLVETRDRLYNHVSSTWLDENWVEEVAPKIKTFIQEALNPQ